MVIGGSKKDVIENIKKNILSNSLNNKVETGDPNLSEEEVKKVINNFYENKKKWNYFFKNRTASKIVKKFACETGNIEVDGIQDLDFIRFIHHFSIFITHQFPILIRHGCAFCKQFSHLH